MPHTLSNSMRPQAGKVARVQRWTRPEIVRLAALSHVADSPWPDGPPGQSGCHPINGCNWRS
ncbi:MAG: hypothetical protein KUG65_13330 [Sphingomonadaceae bacterium]|nr:hypothetical protein [Sphingomonadaceae bacterium]